MREYLYGNEISLESEELCSLFPEKKEEMSGLCILYCDGIALGFAYYRNGKLRNLYPKGLRFRH